MKTLLPVATALALMAAVSPSSAIAQRAKPSGLRAWLQDQAELLDGTQKIMAAWTKRRQEAVEASSRTFQAICVGPQNRPEAVRAWRRDSNSDW